MNWNTAVGPGCLLLGMLFALYIKDKARESAKEQFTDSIAAALAVFKSDLISSLDKVYVRSGECDLMRNAQDDKVDMNTKRLDAHDARFENIKNIRKQ